MEEFCGRKGTSVGVVKGKRLESDVHWGREAERASCVPVVAAWREEKRVSSAGEMTTLQRRSR